MEGNQGLGPFLIKPQFKFPSLLSEWSPQISTRVQDKRIDGADILSLRLFGPFVNLTNLKGLKLLEGFGGDTCSYAESCEFGVGAFFQESYGRPRTRQSMLDIRVPFRQPESASIEVAQFFQLLERS